MDSLKNKASSFGGKKWVISFWPLSRVPFSVTGLPIVLIIYMCVCGAVPISNKACETCQGWWTLGVLIKTTQYSPSSFPLLSFHNPYLFQTLHKCLLYSHLFPSTLVPAWSHYSGSAHSLICSLGWLCKGQHGGYMDRPFSDLWSLSKAILSSQKSVKIHWQRISLNRVRK